MSNCHWSSGVGSRFGVAPPSLFSVPFVLAFSLILSFPILLLLAPHFFPSSSEAPISSADEQDDLSLFRRAAASLSPHPLSYSHLSSKAKFKIAFLFLTNTDLYFSPLWERFFIAKESNLYNIYIHADPTVNLSLPTRGVFKERVVAHSKQTRRASPTLVSATRRLLASAILDDPANAFFAVVSQYCVPLHSFRYTYDALLNTPGFDHSRKPSKSIRTKYKSFIEIIAKERRLWKRYVARGRYAMLPEVPFDKFRVGSQFFVLTKRHALIVIKDRRLWGKFKLPCYRADECYPEEHYFPTLLSMADPDGCTKYSLTHVNWTGTVKGHPYTYKPGEVTADLIQLLRKSNQSGSYLFARKFSPDCLEPLMKLADPVIFRD